MSSDVKYVILNSKLEYLTYVEGVVNFSGDKFSSVSLELGSKIIEHIEDCYLFIFSADLEYFTKLYNSTDDVSLKESYKRHVCKLRYIF